VIFGAELRHLAREQASYRFEPRVANAPVFSRATLDEVAPDFRSRAAFACGPESLLDAVAAVVPDVRVERFRPRFASPAADARGGRVRFARSKRELDAGGATPLLEVAERAGMSPPHGCRIGICHSCDATMRAGAVRDLRTGKILDEPGARFQPCVCAAAGDVEIDL